MDAKKIVQDLKSKFKVKDKYEIAFIMGSGLDGAVLDFEDKIEVEYFKTSMPNSKVEGFSPKFVFGKLNNKNVMKITRYHYYESGDLSLVRLPFEILKEFGVKIVIMATATGGVDESFVAGDVMLVCDHINLSGTNPLINTQKIEFVDMLNAYDEHLQNLTLEICKKHNIDIKTGTHMQFSGPSYETPAEVKMARMLGAKTVSMSLALDTICARKQDIKVLAFASVVNKASDFKTNISHKMVLEQSKKNAQKIKIILQDLLKLI